MLSALLVITSASAALYMEVNPSNVNIPVLGSSQTTITVCTDGSCTTKVSGRALAVQEWCKELGGDPLTCDSGDAMSTSEISVSVATPTDGNGESIVTLTHNGGGQGQYHYTICDDEQSGSCQDGGASVTGDAYIPEFTTIGAGLVLLGAGAFALKKRRK